MSLNDIIPKEACAKIKWTCAEHKTCKTCVYYYYSCHGLTNSKDPRVKKMSEIDRQYFELTWHDVKQEHRLYLFWKRFKAIGIVFLNLHAVASLTLENIQTYINSYRQKIKSARRKKVD